MGRKRDQGFSRIKVLRVMARFNLGGPAQQISSLMTHLDPKLFEQKLIVGFCAQDEIDYSEIRKLEFKVETNKYLGRKINLFSDLFALVSIVKTYYKFKPDVVHSHTAKAGVICRVARIFYFGKLSLVHTYHGHLLYGYFNRFQTQLVVILEKILGLISSKLVAVGFRVKNELVDAGIAKSEKIVVIPPGICFLNIKDDSEVSSKSSQVLSIGFVGRITNIKRPDRFLNIVKKVQQFNLDVRFVVAGDGKLLDEMRQNSINNNLGIEFLGWVANIDSLFQSLDVLILTSDNEGTPISIVQGAANSCIALSTNVGSVEDVLLHEKTGFICDTDDEFAEKLKFLCENRLMLNTMKREARTFAIENFSGTRLARDHATIYNSIINS